MSLTHVVLMKFRDRTDAKQAAELLGGLPDRIPDIRTLHVALDELGTEVSYDLCLTTTHDSQAELTGYQHHPAHRELAAWLVPRLAARAVVDYHT
ncbi:Dabb family protein [Nocardia sp. CDC159]|uniref:Dabb family protein n=1 Tax=Nocardia pulmonis TaxID=2951408 RepID=A0A9X2E0M1_9NOCA|nr:MULTISPECIES: Dabb family protein [Nocardia]MCM6771929.1 Dabb family protein [Nocardia pulmonis]MCM6785413.1 Dabb family protein [Nocardia sp. CDC159]